MARIIVRYNVGIPIEGGKSNWLTIVIQADESDTAQDMEEEAINQAVEALDTPDKVYRVDPRRLSQVEVYQVGGIIVEPG